MSFQRPLTGESTMIATVVLNTNICSNSVSTVNLSATNASFINITTNTWTTGNVSTPNVIATNAYISNLNVSTFNVCNISTSAIYSSNASFTNVSISSQLTVPNISTLQTINGATALRLQNNGGVVVKDRDTSDPALFQLNYASTPSIETYGLYLESNKSGTKAYGRIGAGENSSLQFYADTVIQAENTSTTGWRFYSSINSSYRVNFSSVSVSSMSASSLGISTLNVCNMYAYSIADVAEITSGTNVCILSNALVIRDVGNASTEVLFNYDDATFTDTTGMKFTIGQSGVNISVQDTLPLTLFSGSVSQMTNVSSVGFSFFRPLYSSNIYSSNASIKNLDCNLLFRYASAYGDFLNADEAEIYSTSGYVGNFLKLTGVSAVYTCIYCSNLSVSNLSVSNFALTNLSISNDLDVGDAINASRIFTSTMDVSNIDVYNRIDAQRIILTAAFDSPISNVSDSRVSSIRGVSASFTSMYVSQINTCSITVPSLVTTNFSVSNLSASYLTATSVTFLDTYATNLSTSGIVTTVYFSSVSANISNLSVSNLSGTNASISGRITVSNISTTSVSATGRINADNFRAALDIVSVGGTVIAGQGDFTTLNASNFNVSLQINASTVSCRTISSASIQTSWVNASNGSIRTLHSTSIYVSNGNFSTLNVSTFNPANISTTNFSVSTSATIQSASVSSLFTSALTMLSGNSSYFMQIQQLGVSAYINTVNPQANAFLFATAGSNRIEFNASFFKSYVSFFVSRGNFSVLSVSTFNPNTISTTTINCSNGYFSALYASTWVLPSTIDVSQVNASNICVSNALINNISGTNSFFNLSPTIFTIDAMYIRNYYASVGGIPYLQMDYWRSASSALDRGFTIYSDETRASIIDGGVLSLEFRQNDVTQVTVSTTSGWRFYNTINTSYQTNISNLAVSTANITTVNTSTLNACSLNITTLGADTGNIITVNSTTANVSTLNSSTINNTSGTFTTMSNNTIYSSIINVSRINNTSAYVSNISVSYASITNITMTTASATSLYVSNLSVSNLSVTALTIPNSITSLNASNTLTLHSNTCNTQTTGLRVPNYIDGLDTTSGLFFGYNHTGGFINFDRVIRATGNITLDGNLNQITTTNNLGIGRNLTTGNLFIGDTAMTGNVCINTSGGIQIGNVSMGGNISFDTAGDVVFNCDRRSTWNTSNLVKNSTQLGSFYQQIAAVTTNKTTAGQTYVFSPTNSNTSLSPVPVGLYLVTAHLRIKTFNGYNTNVTNINAGICYGGTYSFTSGNTTRVAYYSLGTINTSGTSNQQSLMTVTGVLNMSVTGQYIGAFMNVSAPAVTVGSLDCIIDCCTVVKIA